MNTDTGRIYSGIGADLSAKLAEPVFVDALRELDGVADEGDRRPGLVAGRALGRQPVGDERAMLADLARGANVVPVSAQVAQKVRLGERELERRRRRNKAARQARKANR